MIETECLTGSGATYCFDNRSAFVTGAGGGIGMQIAASLADAGCRVTAFDIKPCPPELADTDQPVKFVQGDVTDATVVADAVASAASPTLDFIVNAAGIALWGNGKDASDGSVVDIDMTIWEKTLNINLNGAINVVRAGIPLMQKSGFGAIVHIASIVGLRSMDNAMQSGPLDAYQISKAALVSLSRSLAITYGMDGIRSNTVCPGAINTPMTASIYAQAERVESMSGRTPIQRVGTPQDIADATMFLLSDSASFITGADLVVDGGLSTKLG